MRSPRTTVTYMDVEEARPALNLPGRDPVGVRVHPTSLARVISRGPRKANMSLKFERATEDRLHTSRGLLGESASGNCCFVIPRVHLPTYPGR